MTIAPTSWNFTSNGESKPFVVTNNGPDQSQALTRGIFPPPGGNVSGSAYVPDNGCVNQQLAVGATCTVTVQSFSSGEPAFLVVGSDNSQLDPDLTSPAGDVRGAKAALSS